MLGNQRTSDQPTTKSLTWKTNVQYFDCPPQYCKTTVGCRWRIEKRLWFEAVNYNWEERRLFLKLKLFPHSKPPPVKFKRNSELNTATWQLEYNTAVRTNYKPWHLRLKPAIKRRQPLCQTWTITNNKYPTNCGMWPYAMPENERNHFYRKSKRLRNKSDH